MERSGRRVPIMKNKRIAGHSTLFDGHDTKVSFKSADARMPEVYQMKMEENRWVRPAEMVMEEDS